MSWQGEKIANTPPCLFYFLKEARKDTLVMSISDMLETSILDLSSKSKNSLKILSGLRIHQELAHIHSQETFRYC